MRHYHVGKGVPGLHTTEPVLTADRYDEARGVWRNEVLSALSAAFGQGDLDQPDVAKLREQLEQYSGDIIEYQNGRSIMVLGQVYWFAVCELGEGRCYWQPGHQVTETNLNRAAPPEGFYYNDNGTLLYSIADHIKRAFKNAPRVNPGGPLFLTAAEISTFGNLPGEAAGRGGPGAIQARLGGLLRGLGTPIEGITPAYKYPAERRVLGAWG